MRWLCRLVNCLCCCCSTLISQSDHNCRFLARGNLLIMEPSSDKDGQFRKCWAIFMEQSFPLPEIHQTTATNIVASNSQVHLNGITTSCQLLKYSKSYFLCHFLAAQAALKMMRPLTYSLTARGVRSLPAQRSSLQGLVECKSKYRKGHWKLSVRL